MPRERPRMVTPYLAVGDAAQAIEWYKRAFGAKVTMPLEDQFWGDRYGKLQDPFGHSWGFSYPAKMTEAEKERKREEAFKSFGAGEHPGAQQ